MAAGSWSLVEELFARGDDQFVGELRHVHFADRLGGFASRWIADQRPFARQALFEYLSLPLNCYRHEPLVKRLFKLAEKAGDDELMRRVPHGVRSHDPPRQTEADTLQAPVVSDSDSGRATSPEMGGRRLFARPGQWGGESILRLRLEAGRSRRHAGEYPDAPAGRIGPQEESTHPRLHAAALREAIPTLLASHAPLSAPPGLALLPRIGKSNPERYLRAAAGFLSRYTDSDTDSDIHLLDNWGFVHALFRYSPAPGVPGAGWEFAPGKTLADLAPAPRFEAAWACAPGGRLRVAAEGERSNGPPVGRPDAAAHHAILARVPARGDLLRLADHDDSSLSDLGFDLLESAPNLESVPVEEWLKRLDGDDLAKLQRLSALLTRRLDPARMNTADALRLAAHRSKPVADLGLAMLRRRAFTVGDAVVLLPLVQAECDLARPALIELAPRDARAVRHRGAGVGTRVPRQQACRCSRGGLGLVERIALARRTGPLALAPRIALRRHPRSARGSAGGANGWR